MKEVSSLMLDIRDMSDEDKLFNFMAGLQPWAQAELRRQGVQSVATAIAAADRLVDFKAVGSNESGDEAHDSDVGKDSGNHAGKEGKSKKKQHQKGERGQDV